MAPLTVQSLAKLIGGTLDLQRVDPGFEISGVCSLEDSQKSKLSFAKEPAVSIPLGTQLGALIIGKDALFDGPPTIALIRVVDPVHSMVLAIKHFVPETLPTRGISPKADIDGSAELGKNIYVGAFSSVGAHSKIGDNSTIYPGVIIYHDVVIGKNCVLHSGVIIRSGVTIADGAIIQNGAVIGADGFGYYPLKHADGKLTLEKFPQVGGVTIGPLAEVGANTCVDRGALSNTEIGYSSKLDNLVQIGHNVKIGSMSILCGQVGVAGSTKIGNGVTLGGSVGVRDHISISDGVRVAARSGVTSNLVVAGDYAGFPATKAEDWKREVASVRMLPEFIKKVRGFIKGR